MNSSRRFISTITGSRLVFMITFGFLAATYTPRVAAQTTDEAAAIPDAAYTFTIDSTQSYARYRAREVLKTQGAIEAVGETQAKHWHPVLRRYLYSTGGNPDRYRSPHAGQRRIES